MKEETITLNLSKQFKKFLKDNDKLLRMLGD